MNKLTTHNIAKMLGAEVLDKAEVTGVSVDSRLVKPGDLFVCLRGERVDGHEYAQLAIDKGATALMVDRELDLDISQILVPDTYKGLIEFAKAYRKTLPMQAIAITGSNGKTSTKDMLQSILEKMMPTVATYKNGNTIIGTCLTLFRCDSETKFGVFEMGLDMPGELVQMTKIIKPDAAILTSLDQAHMDNFNDNILELGKEKFSIFETIEDKSLCFYQGDFEVYRNLAQDEKSFGFNDYNDFIISEVEITDLNHFKVNNRSYSCNLLGKHQASNAAGVIALLRSLGINDEKIQEGLVDVTLTEMRAEIYEKDQATILFDAYKSSPQSLMSALELFESMPSNKARYMVLADMYQLGLGTEKRHREALEKALNQNVVKIFLFGEEFANAAQSFNDDRLVVFDNKDVLKEAVRPLYKKETFILFKGSRYYKLEELLKEA